MRARSLSCGGDAAVFAKARPILEGMGKNIVHCGEPGLGQATKICNNMLAGINALAVAEAFVMGSACVDRATLYDVITTSSGNSNVATNSCPMPGVVPTAACNNDFKPGFAARLMLKDLRLSQAASQETGTSTPLGAAATAAFAMYVDQGGGDLDVSSIIKLLEPNPLESMTIKLLALDADDTLWHNEPIYQNTQKRFRDLLFEYHDPAWVEARLNETEIRNLTHFGYGVKVRPVDDRDGHRAVRRAC